MITTELELMQASSDAEQDAQELFEKFMVEWLGKRGQPKAQPQPPPMPMLEGPGGVPMPTQGGPGGVPMPQQGQQVMYG